MGAPLRHCLLVAAALSLGCGVAAADPGYVANVIPCEQRTLVLSAFPAEADAVLAHTALEANPVVVADRRRYYLGSISGKKVIVAMTGIGLVNATNTTETAFARFTCASSIAIAAVMFSGVAGGAGRTSIGDVAIPARWTLDNGATFRGVDPGMLATAQTLSVVLDNINTLGNPVCLCRNVPVVRLNHLGRQPQLFVGGDGSSSDKNNGQAFPCIPNGGSVFGCQPCSAPDRSLGYTGNFFQAAGPWLKNALISNLNIVSTVNPGFDAVTRRRQPRRRSPMHTASRSWEFAVCPTGPATRCICRASPSSSSFTSRLRPTTPPGSPKPSCRTGPASDYAVPRPTGRVGSELHSDHDPGNSAASWPITASAATMTAALTPEPQ